MLPGLLILLLGGLRGAGAGAPPFAVFRDALHPAPLQLLALHPCPASPTSPCAPDLYAGGRDALYRLDARDLSLRGRASTGPGLDCAPGEECGAEAGGVRSDEARVLLLTPDGGALLACGTLHRGACRLHSPHALASSVEVGPAGESVSLVSGRGSAVAFWGADNASLFAAATYDGRPPALAPASVSRRLLAPLPPGEGPGFSLRYAHREPGEISAVDFAQPYKRTYKVEYVAGFSHGGHAYFVTVQPVSGESADAAAETRLARVCERDPRFLSYAELPLGCRLGGQPYLYAAARAAHLAQGVSASLRNRLKLRGGDGAVLFVSFVSALPGGGGPPPVQADPRRGSVVCSFPMAAVRAAFANATAACFRGEPRTHLLRHVVGAEAPCTAKEEEAGAAASPDFCGSEFNPFVEARDPLQGGVRLHLEAEVTSLFAAVQRGSSVLFAGTRDGQLVKVHLDRARGQTLYSRTVAAAGAEDRRVRPSNAYDPRTESLYLLAGDQVVLFPAGSCSAYESCARCLGAEDPLGCGWCGDRCAHRDECPTPDALAHDACPPLLLSVSPLRGPLAGGTLLTVWGDNFGRPGEGEEVSRIRIEVAGQPCPLHSWDKEKVQCRTSPASEPLSGKVCINVSDSTWIKGLFSMEGAACSDEAFQYVEPVLEAASPDRGPVSGGTELSLVGRHLDAGSERRVTVCGEPCQLIEAAAGRARCLTGPRGNGSCEGAVELRIDGAALSLDGAAPPFRYLPDPEVRDIEPRVATVSGSTNLTVSGSHLDSVAQPRMVVAVASPLTGQKLEFRTACAPDGPGGERMRCPTPLLPAGAGDLRAPTERAPLVASVSLEMDGARGPRELPQREPLLSQLLLYPDPELEPFNGSLAVRGEQAFLALKGRYLDLALGPADVSVEVGGAPCTLAALSREEIVCELPAALPRDAPAAVQVRMGSLRFSPGSLEFVPGGTSPRAALVGGLLTGAACLALAALGLFLGRRLRGRKPPSYMVAYTAEQQPPCGGDAPCGAPPRRQGSRANDYGDLRGRALARAAAAAAERGGCQEEQDEEEEEEGRQWSAGVDEEMLHLLRAENILIERERLLLGEVIGQGHFGCVYKGQLRSADQEEGTTEVAVKTLHNSPARDAAAFLQEGLMMRDFRHRHVLTLVGVCLEEGGGGPLVVIPYMRNGDLHSWIRDEAHSPTVKELLTFGVQIAAGMGYLAELKFVHRDLAARNCMLSAEREVKVADFGLSRDVYERDYYSSDNKKTKLPVKWMAPESLEKGTYSTRTDAWSYGVVLWELTTRGVTPYPDVDNWDILQYLKSGRRMPQPSYCPDLLYGIMLRCWSEEAAQRPSFAELEEQVRGVITALEGAGRQKTVGLDVTYVNYPGPRTRSE